MLKCEHCESAALATRDEYAPVARGKEVHAKRREWQRQSLRTPFAPPRVGEEAGGCRHADEPFDSSHASRGERNRWPLDAAGYSPGAAFWSHCLAIDTARAADRGGNCECWPHTPHVGFHRLLGVVHAGSVSALPGNAACHQAGEESRLRCSAPFSRTWPWSVDRIQRQERLKLDVWQPARDALGEQEQTR